MLHITSNVTYTFHLLIFTFYTFTFFRPLPLQVRLVRPRA